MTQTLVPTETLRQVLDALEGIHRCSEYPAIQPAADKIRALLEKPSEPDRTAFETWAQTILSDNPTWRESADCELAWQTWRKAKETP
jgi:hypothetical protein